MAPRFPFSATSVFFAIFCFVTAPLAIFTLVTALFFSCFAPTLFFGRRTLPAATDVPPSATKSAIRARWCLRM